MRPGGARWLLVEPARPARVREWPGAAWLAVATVCIGAFMGQLDASIVTVALPTLRSSFAVSLGAVEWVTLAYVLVLVTAVIAVGNVADTFGRKLLYTYGFVVFVVASVACGLAPSLGVLLGARVVQALGAAMLQANSVALVKEAAPPGRLGRALGMQGVAQALGLAAGPPLGGLLIGLGGWRLVFLVNLPLGVLATVLAWLLLPRSRNLAERRAFDWAGLALLVPAVGGVLAALSLVTDAGWTSPMVLLPALAAVVSGIAFVGVERRRSAPLFDLRLLRIPALAGGVATGFGAYLLLFGTLFAVPFYLELAAHRSAAAAGLQLCVLPAAFAVSAGVAGRLADRVGPRVPVVLGIAVSTLALLGMVLWHGATAALLVETALLGGGLGMVLPANTAMVMEASPARCAGVVGGLLNMTRGVGMAAGVALSGLAFSLAGSGAVDAPARAERGLTAAALQLAVVGACMLLAAAARLNGRGGGHR